ncbi:MAG: hypothetical protein QM756_34720 [Polyangiaceae bacterium]
MPRLAVIGAGPIGLAAALSGLTRGFEVTLLEAESVGASFERWGDTRFFTPLSMNVGPRFRELGFTLPADDALLSGREFVTQVLEPVAQSERLRGCVRERQRVLAVGRQGLTRGDLADHPLRAERPFRLVVQGPEGEYSVEAERVLDATGVSLPTGLGEGGLPALGEASAAPRVMRDLGALSRNRASLLGKRVLLLGHGHSAANALLELEALVEAAPATRVTWAVRTPNLKPCVDVASDPLPERKRVVSRVNQLAQRPPPWLKVERRASVARLESGPESLQVTLTGERRVNVDALLALTGYRPELGFLSELALAVSPSTEGAFHLARALSHVTDCLSLPKVGPADLRSGEPGFSLVGAKSYGRARTFLLQTGYAQLESVLDGFAG